ncbi:uncharacterized protein [Haliotis cracherodii]|uniref:uncharacterized protein n=1 Tax=Haliotis cracherodii TaxID=6455 RepID=UPI0039E9F581
MYVTVVFLCILLARSLSGLTVPSPKPDGSSDMSSLLNHVALLEQTVSSLLATTTQVQTELQVTKKDLQATQSQLQSTMKDLQHTRTDLQSSKTQHQSEVAEISSLKDEVLAMKAELRLTSNELVMVKTQLKDMAHGDSVADPQLNLTLLDSILHEMKLNTAQMHAVQRDVKQLDKHLTLVNSTVDNIITDKDDFFHNMSSWMQIISQKQSAESTELQSTKLLAHTVSKHVQKLEQDIKSMFSDISVVRQDLQSAWKDLHSVQSNLSLTFSNVLTLQSNISMVGKQSLDNKLSLLQVSQAPKTRNVAFNVNYPPSSTSNGTPLPFSTILYNAGSGYNTSTGTFVAPVSGIYIFWTHLALTQANTNMSFDIIKSGGVILANGYTETDSYIDETDASAITVTHLDKGEEAWVQMTFSRIIYPSSSYFGGALLSED